MNRKRSLAVAAGFLLLVCLIALMWNAAHRPEAPPPTPSAVPTASPTVVETPNITRLFPGGKKQWRIGAKSLEVNNKTNRGVAKDVTWTLMDENQKPYIRAKAPAAEIDMQTKSIDFIGVVDATGRKDEKARINKLYYDGKKNRFYGTKGLRVTKGLSEMTGGEIEIDPETKNFEIRGGVKVIYRSREKILSD